MENQQEVINLNPANICRVTIGNQYYIHHSSTIAGSKILGFNLLDDVINVLGMREDKFKEINQSAKDDGERLKLLKQHSQTISQIPTKLSPVIDWYYHE